MKETILVIDDEEVIRKALDKFLKQQKYHVLLASDGEQGCQMLKEESVDAVLVDLMMPKVSGLEVVKKIQEINPDIACIMMTAFGTIANAIEAIKAGAYHYLTKPFELDEVKDLLHKALDYRRLKVENVQLKRQIKDKYKFELLCGETEVSRRVKHVIVAAMEPHNMVHHLEDGTLVLVSGDRIDNILLAVSSHLVGSQKDFQIAGIILTGGLMPNEKIVDLLSKSKIPVLIDKEDTYSVAAKLENLICKIEKTDKDKIAEIGRLVKKYVDIDQILELSK